MKVWIVKNALTKGIEEKEVDINDKGYARPVKDRSFSLYTPNDYCIKKEDAIKKAEEMRVRKIATLKKQIKKLENIKFM